MNGLPRSVEIVEEGPREGFQLEGKDVPTSEKIALIDALSATGLRTIPIVSFTNPKRVPGMADAEDVVNGIALRDGVAFTAIWFNEMGLKRALRSGRLAMTGKLRAYASAAFLARNLQRTPEQHIAETRQDIVRNREAGLRTTVVSVGAAFGCNFEGDILPQTALGMLEDTMRIAADSGETIEEITLADTMAWATPDRVQRLVGAVRDRYPDVTIGLHLHDTRGMGIANALAGLLMGVSHFDAAVAGLGGCPFAAHKGAAGNVCTEDLVFLCEEMGISTGIDLDALIACAEMAERIVGRPLPGSVKHGGNLSRMRTRP
jgi:hydroxymethylglutaryl-CoA lyase